MCRYPPKDAHGTGHYYYYLVIIRKSSKPFRLLLVIFTEKYNRVLVLRKDEMMAPKMTMLVFYKWIIAPALAHVII